MLFPSLAFQQNPKGIPQSEPTPEPEISPIMENASTDCSLFIPEKQRLYEQRYAEGYDIHDLEYEAWLKITHPIDAKSESRSDASVKSTSSSLPYNVPSCVHSSSGSSDILRAMLVLPQPKERSQKRKKAVNSKAICITDLEVLEELKVKEAAKLEEEEAKERKKIEREQKKQNAALEMGRRKENSLKKQEKEQLKTDHKNKIPSCAADRGDLYEGKKNQRTYAKLDN